MLNVKIPALVVLCILSATANLSLAQELWRGTSVGMTEDQVRAVISGVVKAEAPSKFGGATESLRLPGVEVARILFEASFCFEDGRLRQVSLLATDPRSFNDSLDRFNALSSHFRGDYGQEQSTVSRRGITDYESSVWVKGDRLVSLLLVGVLTKAHLVISYQPESVWRIRAGSLFAQPPRPVADSAEEHKRYLAAKAKAEKGDADAQLEMGVLLFAGSGVEKDGAEAVIWVRRAAEQNHVKAQAMLGGAYAQGMGVARDSIEAVQWFRRAAEQGDPLAQNALGFMYASGQGVQRDAKEAVKWYEKGADQGYDQAQYNLGYSYEHGEGVEMNYLRAVEWYRKAADLNYPEAQFNLANCYYSGHGVQQNPVEAYAWYSLAAGRHELAATGRDRLADKMSPGQLLDSLGLIKVLRAQYEARLLGIDLLDGELPVLKSKAVEGDAEAQSRLAFRCHQGQGVEKNVTEAVKWWGQAAGQNLAEAQFSMGVCHHDGQGMPKDEAEAYKWWLLAGAQGFEVARQTMTRLERRLTRAQLAEGQKRAGDFKLPEVPPSRAETAAADVKIPANLLAKARAGDAQAQNELGEAFYAGKQGVARNPVEAVKWFRQSVAQNFAAAQSNLGVCYERGDGVAKYEVEAYKWYLLAAAQGYNKAKRNASMLELMLSKDQLAEGKQRAQDWLEQRQKGSTGMR